MIKILDIKKTSEETAPSDWTCDREAQPAHGGSQGELLGGRGARGNIQSLMKETEMWGGRLERKQKSDYAEPGLLLLGRVEFMCMMDLSSRWAFNIICFF